MINTSFDPSIIFMSNPDEWEDHHKRDNFINHLLENIRIINKYNITKIFWTDELEEFLWNNPELPPWKAHINWKYPIVPIIYNMFSKCLDRIIDFEEDTECEIKPSLNCVCSDNEIHKSFLRLMHCLIKREENVFFCTSPKNMLPESHNYSFFCSCHDFNLITTLIFSPEIWINHINLESNYWPSARSKEEIEKFREAINITAKREFGKELDDEFLYKYNFSEQFLNNIIQEQSIKQKILFSISKRLLFNQSSASKDSGLRDEQVKGKKSERRFRVSSESRIHYSYIGQKEILFLNFYGEGEHDSGLK